MSCILDRIQKANDIKKIDEKDYEALAGEIREFIIQSVSENGGHLASNLGVVELTMALHLCLNFPEDKLIWDVGHQSYTHKILTGRKEAFAGLRTYKGMSGFPKHGRVSVTPSIQATVPRQYRQLWGTPGRGILWARIIQLPQSSEMVR